MVLIVRGTDFRAYAEYITTDRFLASHLAASIAGAALGLLGIIALLAFLARGRAVTAAIVGTALTVVGNVGNVALFGVAAFAHPAIGRAYLDGAQGIPELNDDVYGTPLLATAGVSILCFVTGAILVGIAICPDGRPAAVGQDRLCGEPRALPHPLLHVRCSVRIVLV